MRGKNIPQIQQVSWTRVVKKNAYPMLSVVVLLVYFYAAFFAVSFLVINIRAAFTVNNTQANKQVVNFNLEDYEKIAKRFGLQK